MALRDELRTLGYCLPERPEAPFPELTRLARSVTNRPHELDSPEDLVSDLLVDLLQQREALRAAQKRGQTGGEDPIEELLGLGDGDLTAVVRRRLRQLAVEARPRWNLYRALRQHVAAVLLKLPAPPVAPPPSLQRDAGHHLHRKRVAAAVSWLLTQPEAPARDPTSVTTRLLQIYSPDQERRQLGDADPADSADDPETRTRRRWDGDRLMSALGMKVDKRQLEAFVRRCAGETFQQISRGMGVSLATAHAWVAEVSGVFRKLVLIQSSSLGTVLAALAWEKTARELKLPKTTSRRCRGTSGLV